MRINTCQTNTNEEQVEKQIETLKDMSQKMIYTKVRQILEQIKNIKRIQRKRRCANIFKKNSFKRDTYGGRSSLDEVGTLQSNNLNADMLK